MAAVARGPALSQTIARLLLDTSVDGRARMLYDVKRISFCVRVATGLRLRWPLGRGGALEHRASLVRIIVRTSTCMVHYLANNAYKDGNQVAPLTREHPRRRYTPVDTP